MLKFITAVTVTVAVSVLSAGCAGTGTGNPIYNNANGGPLTEGALIVEDICRKITSCHTGITPQVCVDAVEDVAGLPAEFGVNPGYPTLKHVAASEDKKELVANKAQYLVCKQDMSSLACDDPLVVNAYQSGQMDPWALLNLMVPATCEGVYPP